MIEWWDCFQQDKNPASRANVLKSFTTVSLFSLGGRFLFLKVVEKKNLDHRGASICFGEESVYVVHHLWSSGLGSFKSKILICESVLTIHSKTVLQCCCFVSVVDICYKTLSFRFILYSSPVRSDKFNLFSIYFDLC